MRQRILGVLGGRRRRSVLAVMAAAVAAGLLLISNAFAVHDLVFQLDGDVSSSTTTNVGGNTQTIEWDDFFNAAGQPLALPDDFDASSFDRDFSQKPGGAFSTSDNTTFATGSKDTLAITPGWQCNQDNNVLSKNDVMNAYAASYTDPGSGDEVMYFALERNANTGTANVGFWFLQDGTVDCSSPGGATAFTGEHTDGDLLVVSEFSSGGTVSTIKVYRWNDPDGNGEDPNFGQTAAASGVDCESPSTPADDDACATVNTGTITTPWLTSNKQDGVGHSLRVSEFFEGGINLTDANLGGRCFNTFLADTRSSTSVTATLFDYSRGELGVCDSETVTTPLDGDDQEIPDEGLDIPSDPDEAALEVKDKASITVTGVSPFEGNVAFHLCGPLPADSTDVCDTGGVEVSDEDITTNGDYTSDAATVTAAGRYCWRADFTSTTQGVPDSSDSSPTECFVVNPVTPTLTTEAGAGPVDFGNPVTDTATLTGTAHRPGTGGPAGSNGSINPATLGGDAQGTITFTLYKDTPGAPGGNCSVKATSNDPDEENPQTVTVSGDGTYGPVSFTPDAPGLYHWVASYGGDPPNTLASDPSECLDENEDVVVRRIDTEISTAQRVLPQDSATIESSVAGENLPGGGSVTFRLYGPTNGNTALQNCQAHGDTVGQGGLLYKETDTNVGGGGTATTDTNNTNVSVSDASTVYWRVTYNPNDPRFIGRQSDCEESTQLAFDNDTGPGSILDPPAFP